MQKMLRCRLCRTLAGRTLWALQRFPYNEFKHYVCFEGEDLRYATAFSLFQLMLYMCRVEFEKISSLEFWRCTSPSNPEIFCSLLLEYISIRVSCLSRLCDCRCYHVSTLCRRVRCSDWDCKGAWQPAIFLTKEKTERFMNICSAVILYAETLFMEPVKA